MYLLWKIVCFLVSIVMLIFRGVVFMDVPHHIVFMSSSPPRPRRNRFHKMILRKITLQNSFTFEKKNEVVDWRTKNNINWMHLSMACCDNYFRFLGPFAKNQVDPAKLRRCFFSLIEGKLTSFCHLPWPKRRPHFFSKRKTSFGWLISRFFPETFQVNRFEWREDVQFAWLSSSKIAPFTRPPPHGA